MTQPATASTTPPAEPPATLAESCESAAALNEAGDREGAHAAYLKVLAAKPSSECALAGAKQTAASTSIWAWFGDAAANAGKALAALVLGALLLTILALILLQVQTRTPGLRDRWPARRIRRPTLQIGTIDDGALSDHLGSATAGLIRGRISWRKDRFGVNLVSGQAGVATALRDLGDISGEAKAAVAVISLLTALLPRRRFVLSGELQPEGAEGAGISLELNQQEDYEALITFWAAPLGIERKTTIAAAYQHLAIAAAAWADHRMASAVGGDDLLTGDPQSWAVFRCGVDAQRRGEEKCARSLYEQARVMDGANVGALANLGILCRRRNEYEDAERYLKQALEATEDSTALPKLQTDLNPDWYRIKYQLAALYTNWASDSDLEPQKEKRAEQAASGAKELARQTLQAIQQPPPTGIGSKVPAGYVKKTLMPFLKGTIEPSALILVACTAAGAPKKSFAARPKRAEILSSFKTDSINPWQLIAYVEQGPHHPPNAFFDLACFYTRTRDFGRAADRLATAVRDTPTAERKALIEVAKNDPTLESMRASRPGLIPKLLELVDSDANLADEDGKLARKFDFEDHVHDQLKDEGWTVTWAEPSSHFTMIAEKDSESQLIELASVDGRFDEENAATTIGMLRMLRQGDLGRADARALVILPHDVVVIDVDHATVNGQDVYLAQATERGSFIRLPRS